MPRIISGAIEAKAAKSYLLHFAAVQQMGSGLKQTSMYEYHQRAATDDYRDNWERIYGKHDEAKDIASAARQHYEDVLTEMVLHNNRVARIEYATKTPAETRQCLNNLSIHV